MLAAGVTVVLGFVIAALLTVGVIKVLIQPTDLLIITAGSLICCSVGSLGASPTSPVVRIRLTPLSKEGFGERRLVARESR